MLNGNVWCKSCLQKVACLVAGLTVFGLADNPISSYHYLADPAAASDGEYFYVITDSDDPAAANANGYENSSAASVALAWSGNSVSITTSSSAAYSFDRSDEQYFYAALLMAE